MRKHVPLSEIRRLYATGRSLVWIGNRFGTSGELIRRRLHAANVVLRPASPRLGVSTDDLIHLYQDDGLSQRQVAATLRVSQASVSLKLKAAGIPARPCNRWKPTGTATDTDTALLLAVDRKGES